MNSFSFVAGAPKMVDLTAGLQMPPQSNTRIPRSSKGSSKSETDKFDALANEELMLRMQDEKLSGMRQALDVRIKKLYDSGDVKGAEQEAISGMSQLKLMQIKNQVTKNEAVSRKKSHEDLIKQVGTDDMNRLYLHKDENGGFSQVFNPETGKAMTNAEVASKGWEGVTVVAAKNAEGKPVIDKTTGKPLMTFGSTAALNANGEVSLSASNIGFNKYSDWKKPYVDLFKGKDQYETGGYAGMAKLGDKTFKVESTHSDDKANIDNAYKALFTDVEKKNGKTVRYFHVEKMLDQMSDQDKQSFYQDYYGSSEYRKGVSQGEFARKRMTEISDASRDVTKDKKSYTEISDPADKTKEAGFTEYQQFVKGLLPIDNVGKEQLMMDNKGNIMMPHYYNNGAKAEGKFMDVRSNTGKTANAAFISKNGVGGSSNNIRSGNLGVDLLLNHMIDNSPNVKVLNSSNAQNFAPPGLNPWVSKTIGWSNLNYKNTDKNSTMDDNVVKTGYSIGSGSGSYRVPKIWLAGGIEVDVSQLESKAGGTVGSKKILVMNTDALSRDWLYNGESVGVSHSLIVLPKKAAGVTSDMLNIQATNDGVSLSSMPLFDYRGNVTTAGKAAGAITSTPRELIKQKTNIDIDENYAYKGNPTPANKKMADDMINTFTNGGYQYEDKFSGVNAIVPIFSQKMGLNVGGKDDIVNNPTTKTSTTVAKQGSSNL